MYANTHKRTVCVCVCRNMIRRCRIHCGDNISNLTAGVGVGPGGRESAFKLRDFFAFTTRAKSLAFFVLLFFFWPYSFMS